MMKQLMLWAGLAMGLAGGAAAGERVVVVELYTSQGCSSCPPADELLRELAPRDDVIALALHVDYWDYIGWKDAFARPEHTKRQKGYAYVAGDRTIYTPQMIVDGREHVIGYNPMRLAKLLETSGAAAQTVTLELSRQGSKLDILVSPKATVGNAVVQLVRYNPGATVNIGRGENKGKTLTYANIVTDWQVVGEWDGSAELRMSVDIDGEEPLAVLVQSPGYGPILGAARLR